MAIIQQFCTTKNIERMAQGNIRILLYDEGKKDSLKIIEKNKKNFN